MKRYFMNLWFALTGFNPYQRELEEMREKYEKTAVRVTDLQDMYFKVLDLNGVISRKVSQLEKQVNDGARLVENLRERVRSKDSLISRMKADYQERIGKYVVEIDRLRNGEQDGRGTGN